MVSGDQAADGYADIGSDDIWQDLERYCRVHGRSGYNFKASYGAPILLRRVVERVRLEIPPQGGLIAADEGVASFVGALALLSGTPFWVVRNRLEHNRVSMGTDTERDHAWISGDASTEGEPCVLVDDIMGSGSKLLRALTLSRQAGLTVGSALVILAYQDERAEATRVLGEAGCEIRVLHEVGQNAI